MRVSAPSPQSRSTDPRRPSLCEPSLCEPEDAETVLLLRCARSVSGRSGRARTFARHLLAAALVVSLAVGCGSDDGGGGGGEADADAATDTGGGDSDTGTLDIKLPDSTDTGGDPDGDAGSDPDADTGSDPDGDTGSDLDSDGGSDPDGDAGSDPDADAVADADTAENDADAGGPKTDLPPGSPCGPGIGTCIQGSACIETAPGSPDSECYENATLGEPCGPGAGKCVSGTKCAAPEPGAGTICLQEVGAGASCLLDGITCASGLICQPTNFVAGFEYFDTAQAGAWGDTTGLSRLAIDALNQTAIVAHPTGNRILVYNLVGGGGSVVDAFGESGPLSAPTGAAVRLDTTPPGALLADGGNGRFAFSPGIGTYFPTGTPGAAAGQFSAGQPADVAFAQQEGQLQFWATDTDKGLVYRFSAASPHSYLASFDGGETPLIAPSGLFSRADVTYVVDTGAAAIRLFNLLGDSLGSMGSPAEADGGLTAPTDIACSEELDLCVVTEPSTGRLIGYQLDGTLRFTMSGLEEAPDWQPSGVGFFDGHLYLSDATSGTLFELAPVMDSICVAPLGLGADCTSAIAPCVTGLSCDPVDPTTTISICKAIADEGEPCDNGATACAEGLDCVTSSASEAYAAKCLPAGGAGSPCGPGVGGCLPGFGCNWDGPAHNNRLCFAKIGEGALCNTYAQGGCQDGLTCEIDKLGNPPMVCKPIAGEGEPCGQGLASCPYGFSCVPMGSVLDRFCVADSQVGAECGLFLPDCTDGSSCAFADETLDVIQCFPDDAGIGESCGGIAEGLCSDEDATCISLDATGVNNQCFANSTPVGQSCGGVGVADCVAGSFCIVNQLPATSASCYADGSDGDACGVAAGICDEAQGVGCFITNSTALTGDCRPRQPDLAPCGSSISDVGACSLLGHVCGCDDPFLGPTCTDGVETGQQVCIPQVGPFEICATNSIGGDTVPVDKGWVGLCSGSAPLCSPAAYGPTADPAFAQWVIYMCKLAAEEGEACGLFHACDEGYACFCNGTDCTLDQIVQGDVGICTFVGP